MALDVKKKGSTFTVTDADLVSGGDKDTTYTVRYFTAFDAERLQEQHTTEKYNPSMQRMLPELDGRGLADAVLDHVIVDWDGVESDGQPLPCILVNKKLLPPDRRERLLTLARSNASVTQKEASFRATEDVC